MPYSKEIIDKAMQTIDERRLSAEQENERRLEEINLRFPDIYQKEKLTRSTVMRLMAAAAGGKWGETELLEKIEKERRESIEYVRSHLRQNGYPEDYLDTPFTCKVCGDRGSIGGKACECYKKLLKELAAAQMTNGRLHSFKDVRMDVYSNPAQLAEMTKLIDYLKRYTESFERSANRRSLLFYGTTGTGKTFLSSCVAGELASRGLTVCFGTAYEYFKSIEDEYFKNAGGDTESTLLNCDLLIIDDLGSEFRTSYTESVLYNLLNTRLENGRPTIVSTNITLDALKGRYNERISSRICGVFLPIRFNGEDVRLKLQGEGIYK